MRKWDSGRKIGGRRNRRESRPMLTVIIGDVLGANHQRLLQTLPRRHRTHVRQTKGGQILRADGAGLGFVS